MITSIERRKFITRILLLNLVGVGSSLKSLPAIALKELELGDQIAIKQECLEVYASWLNKEESEPKDFFMKKMSENSYQSCSLLCHSEFIDGEIFEVNGLCLSKTEAAVIAYLGSKFLSL